jgi:hypothetical protein
MLRRGGGSFSFFITPKAVAQPNSMFSFAEDVVPYFLTITLFASMTMDECKMLATLLCSAKNCYMVLPRDFDHFRYHGDAVTLPFSKLNKHFHAFFGVPPVGSYLSMGAFFDYLRDEVFFVKNTQKKSSRI